MHPGARSAVVACLAATALSATTATGAEEEADELAATQRPGLFRLGALYVTPKLRLGTVGIDTNVFYTATERQTDFTATVGPGLELVLPMGALELKVDGGADYIYYARTESQRRWAGDGHAALTWERGRFMAELEQGFARTFSRPSFEVDQRILEDLWTTRGAVEMRIVGGFSTKLEAWRGDNEVREDVVYLGTDLAAALTREERRLVGKLRQAVTLKTTLVAGGDAQTERYELDPNRDADSNRAFAGFEIESLTRLAGKAFGGVRFYRPLARGDGEELHEPYAAVDLIYHLGPRTFLGLRYDHDLVPSTFEPETGAAVLKQTALGVRLQKGLPARMDIEISGNYTRMQSLAPITVVQPSGPQTAVRDDKVWQAGADLGFRFRTHYRLGFGATYTDRNSTFEDFGIEGLLAGATLRYLP
jgi:hypothetical protein